MLSHNYIVPDIFDTDFFHELLDYVWRLERDQVHSQHKRHEQEKITSLYFCVAEIWIWLDFTVFIHINKNLSRKASYQFQ